MYKVPERFPWMAGATCSCWSTRFGGSIRQSERVVQAGGPRRQIQQEWEQILAEIRNRRFEQSRKFDCWSEIWTSEISCSKIVGGYRAQIWTKLRDRSFIWWGSRHKYQGTIQFGGVFIRAGNLGFLASKISNFFCEEIYDEIIWEII